MKRIFVGVMIFIAGFVGGLISFLKILTKCGNTLNGFKKGLIDDIEYLLFGYNTIKGARKYRYQPYYRRRPYSGCYTTYRDYYGDKSFEEDEKEET